MLGLLGQHAGSRDRRSPAMGALAPERGAVPARGPRRVALRAAVSPSRMRASPPPCATTSGTCRPRRRCACTSTPRPTRGTSRRCTARCTTSRARYPFDPGREDYLVHITTGHPRRADLPVPADRVAPHPRAPAADRPPRRDASHEPGGYQIIDLDLSKYDRIATRFAKDAARRADDAEVRHRDAQRGLQRADRAHRARRDRARAAPMLLLGPTGAGKSRWRGASTS